ncbi:hypothetical protein GCM10011363_40310 [Marivita lacus]|uniref:Phage tail protein n=1 Tax=Marivita lacus TaxID=1323742 RepID=A0ABQ1L651_9RHOB|nr:hypothetical protein [Marivita lacus]GGC19535.1 hypothetical protein GCM10011363_40310 [Marivita lacus]
MTLFNDLDAQVSGAIDAAFGEVAVLRPRASMPYAERAEDPSRQVATVTGVFSAGPAEAPLKGGSAGGAFSGGTRIVSQSAEFWLSAETVQSLVERPQKGDALTLTGRAGAPVYALSQVHPSDMGDLTLILVLEDETP